MADYKMDPEWKQWAIDNVIPVIKAERDRKIGGAYDSLSQKIKKVVERGYFNSATEKDFLIEFVREAKEADEAACHSIDLLETICTYPNKEKAFLEGTGNG